MILIGTRENRLEIGRQLGADFTLNIKNENDIVQSVKKLLEKMVLIMSLSVQEQKKL